ncbi:sulfotransferase family protein [Actibacterium lipolyticum]|uniref:Sulfotransferase n=1 Tax=Actibacterium lipolyticum TaxID=1524263 RepID=A0A238KXE0_9RHOB|nr:sulfotransferase [Actibacterium lipolyticum]SMX47300.1 hypothetical protein COL8621_03403 [Actibacterium lipolyticum]
MSLKVIYVVGYGRSGSTILDIALGQHPKIFGAGEIAAMCRHVWANNEYCACGARIQECQFWPDVMAQWLPQAGGVDGFFSLAKQVEPLVSPARILGLGAVKRYADLSASLFQGVADAAGTDVLVDSSKMPGRGLALAESDQIDLRVIHLVRDARGVANAMSRPMEIDVEKGVQKKIKARSPYRTAIRWRMYNSFAERLGRKVGADKFVRVRYEDFAAQPAEEFARIGAATGMDLSAICTALEQSQPIMPAHQMAGSRIRMKKDLTLRFDNNWEDKMTPADQQKVVRVTSEQLRRYGYMSSGSG